jgi:hypothetical protein
MPPPEKGDSEECSWPFALGLFDQNLPPHERRRAPDRNRAHNGRSARRQRLRGADGRMRVQSQGVLLADRGYGADVVRADVGEAACRSSRQRDQAPSRSRSIERSTPYAIASSVVSSASKTLAALPRARTNSPRHFVALSAQQSPVAACAASLQGDTMRQLRSRFPSHEFIARLTKPYSSHPDPRSPNRRPGDPKKLRSSMNPSRSINALASSGSMDS